MRIIIAIFALLICSNLYGQDYATLRSKAEGFGQAKNYSQAVEHYQLAFQIEQKSKSDVYNAACYAALLGDTETAFTWLNSAIELGWTNRTHLTSDSDLSGLHNDPRWLQALKRLDERLAIIEKDYDKPLQAKLLKIFSDDQKGRGQLNQVEEKFGYKSKEVRALWRSIERTDKRNLVHVKEIIAKHGWVGPDKVGGQASNTIFLVIQHSDQKTQEKYLPMMREAVKDKKARADSLALLEDRVLMGQGKKQIYGSQIQADKDGNLHVYAIDDPDHVDQRREAIGLPPMSEYVKYFKLTWDLEAYKNSSESELSKQKPR